MSFIPNISIFTRSGTVFSKFIALELLSETVRNKWRHNYVISSHSAITVSLVIKINAYTILCKSGGGSEAVLKLQSPRRSKKARSK